MIWISKQRALFLGVVLSMLGVYAHAVYAHGDEIEVNQPPSAATQLTLTQAQLKALDIKLSPITQQTMVQQLLLNGEVALLPDAQAEVTIRISGQVSSITASLGEQVKQGQVLASVQSRLVGDPPPSVNVTAPMSGEIDARNITLGQAVEPNTVLFHISNRQQMLIIARVYEEDLGKLAIGQRAIIKALSFPDKQFNGKVTLIEPTIDSLTRTVKVWIAVDNTDNLLKPNMFTQAAILLKQQDNAMVIPTEAIIQANNETFVFIQNPQHQFQRKVITIGSSQGPYTEVMHGLLTTDTVVTQGNRELYTLWLTGKFTTQAGEE